MTLVIGFWCSVDLDNEEEILTTGQERDFAGTYTFTVDGLPVNADIESWPEGNLSWRGEDMSMSLQLIEGLTQWRTGNRGHAFCIYDYIEFEIQEMGKGQLELRSHHVGAWEGDHRAICSQVEFWPAFAMATEDWMARLRRFQEKIDATADLTKKEAFQRFAKKIKLAEWEKAYSAWRTADQAAQISS